MNHPRILHISTTTSWRGGEQQLVYLIEELSKMGVPQHLLCQRNSALHKYAESHQLSHSTAYRSTAISLSFARKLKRTATEFAADLTHVHDSHAHTFAFMAGKILGNKTPIIVSRRVDFEIKKGILSKWKYEFPKVIHIICVSDFIKKIVAHSLPDKRISTVHDGIDLERFSTKKSTVLHTEYRLSKDAILIGNVAAIAPHKDYFTFVKTAEKVLQKRKNIHFFIIGGDGGQLADIQDFISEKKLKKHIHLTGFRSDIVDILPELDVFLFTSKTEGLGTSILDAFTCGVPVVATHAGGIPEIVHHRKNGLTAPVGDSDALAENIETLLNNPHCYQQYVEKAKLTATSFSKIKMATHTLDIYKSEFEKHSKYKTQ